MEGQSNHKRMLWKCRRGTKELDVLLTGFVQDHYHTLSNQEKSLFEALLDVEDPQLTEWLCMDVLPTNQGMVQIVHRILSADNS